MQASTNQLININGEIKIVEKLVNDTDTVFDIGAGTGEWTKLVLNRYQNVKVHLFEPVQSNYKQILQNLSESINAGKVIANNFAIAEKEENRTFYCYTNATTWSTFKRRWSVEKSSMVQSPEELSVLAVELDKYCDQKILNG